MVYSTYADVMCWVFVDFHRELQGVVQRAFSCVHYMLYMIGMLWTPFDTNAKDTLSATNAKYTLYDANAKGVFFVIQMLPICYNI
jgi:hypothetical protein